MFKPQDEARTAAFNSSVVGFIIQPNDRLEVQVFSNGGEKIIDSQSTAPVNNLDQGTEKISYNVDSTGSAVFPMIGRIQLSGLSLQIAEQHLRTAYSVFYKDPFVKLSFANKRVVVLGAFGNKVVPLNNEATRLTEVLALTEATDGFGNVDEIRVLRGENYFIADLGSLQNFNKNNIVIEPNDIIYVEPKKKRFAEGIRDYAPLVSFMTAIVTLFLVLDLN